jgi:uncharacterized protein (TIGR00369 family)
MTESPVNTSPPPRTDFEKHFNEFPLHKFLGVSVVELSDGYAKLVLETGPNTLGGVGGSVHGGVLAALVDITILRALFAVPDPDVVPAGTADLGITYLRPALGKRIYSEGKVIKKGRQMAVIEVDITDENGKLCAKGRTIYAFRR